MGECLLQGCLIVDSKEFGFTLIILDTSIYKLIYL